MAANIYISNDFINGAKANTPIGLSVFAYGAVLGMICAQKGVEIYQLTLMNVFIFYIPQIYFVKLTLSKGRIK